MSLYPTLPLTDGVAYGATTQAGAPTPGIPINMADAIMGGTYEYETGEDRYRVTLPTMRSVGEATDIWAADPGIFAQFIGVKKFFSADLTSLSIGSYNNVAITTAIPGMAHYSTWEDTMDPFFCTHYINMYKPATEWPTFGNIGKACINITGGMWLSMDKHTIDNIDQARAWIDAEAAAGRPVTVYYRLDAPIVSTIEPIKLMSRLVTDHYNGQQYTHADLNRVGTAIAYLAGELNKYGYAVTVSPKTDWTAGETPRAAAMANYLADLNAIKNAFYGTTALPPDMAGLTAEKANNIEKLLLEIDGYITSMVFGFPKCGTFKVGQGVIL